MASAAQRMYNVELELVTTSYGPRVEGIRRVTDIVEQDFSYEPFTWMQSFRAYYIVSFFLLCKHK